MTRQSVNRFIRLMTTGAALSFLTGCDDAETCSQLQQFAQDLFRQALAAFLF